LVIVEVGRKERSKVGFAPFPFLVVGGDFEVGREEEGERGRSGLAVIPGTVEGREGGRRGGRVAEWKKRVSEDTAG
jgi:hypothetical protein